MKPRFRDALVLLGIDPESEIGVRRSDLPSALFDLQRFPAVMSAVAAVYGGDAAFPGAVGMVDSWRDVAFGEPCVLLLIENQGVCAWAVPLTAGDDPPVLVAGSLSSGDRALEFAPTVADFVYALAWDAGLMNRMPMIQAQANPLDQQTRAALERRYTNVGTTIGWPGRQNYRFESDGGLRLGLWAADNQCDWWMSHKTAEALERECAELMALSNLREALWSNDREGEEMLRRMRTASNHKA